MSNEVKHFGQVIPEDVQEIILNSLPGIMKSLNNHEYIVPQLAYLITSIVSSLLIMDKKIERLDKKLTTLLEIHDLGYKEEDYK